MTSCNKTRTVCVLGSTGTVGVKTLDVIYKNYPSYRVVCIVADSNVDLLSVQARLFKVKVAVIRNELFYPKLKSLLSGTQIYVASGDSGVEYASMYDSDVILNAIPGIAGLPYSIIALKRGAVLALANKESIVCGGHLLNSINSGSIVPVDSEHHAISQIYNCRSNFEINNVTITASGGPLYRKGKLHVGVSEVISHPIWKMGRKISVDSANLMNKVLELIECHYLFNLPKNKISVIIHPESIVHGFISYKDGVSVALMYRPDMSVPISNALDWPQPCSRKIEGLLLNECTGLTFDIPDAEEFPALDLFGVDKHITLNAANEVAVCAFLNHEIKFSDIVTIVKEVVEKHEYKKEPDSFEEIFDLDAEARRLCTDMLVKYRDRIYAD